MKEEDLKWSNLGFTAIHMVASYFAKEIYEKKKNNKINDNNNGKKIIPQ